ncbi:hypothetical protein AAVH_18822 [Aphelenchoides avenae]|nr:hypothetical protein AAVH_18822 [Aphelenchus avenae]
MLMALDEDTPTSKEAPDVDEGGATLAPPPFEEPEEKPFILQDPPPPKRPRTPNALDNPPPLDDEPPVDAPADDQKVPEAKEPAPADEESRDEPDQEVEINVQGDAQAEEPRLEAETPDVFVDAVQSPMPEERNVTSPMSENYETPDEAEPEELVKEEEKKEEVNPAEEDAKEEPYVNGTSEEAPPTDDKQEEKPLVLQSPPAGKPRTPHALDKSLSQTEDDGIVILPKKQPGADLPPAADGTQSKRRWKPPPPPEPEHQDIKQKWRPSWRKEETPGVDYEVNGVADPEFEAAEKAIHVRATPQKEIATVSVPVNPRIRIESATESVPPSPLSLPVSTPREEYGTEPTETSGSIPSTPYTIDDSVPVTPSSEANFEEGMESPTKSRKKRRGFSKKAARRTRTSSPTDFRIPFGDPKFVESDNEPSEGHEPPPQPEPEPPAEPEPTPATPPPEPEPMVEEKPVTPPPEPEPLEEEKPVTPPPEPEAEPVKEPVVEAAIEPPPKSPSPPPRPAREERPVSPVRVEADIPPMQFDEGPVEEVSFVAAFIRHPFASAYKPVTPWPTESRYRYIPTRLPDSVPYVREYEPPSRPTGADRMLARIRSRSIIRQYELRDYRYTPAPLVTSRVSRRGNYTYSQSTLQSVSRTASSSSVLDYSGRGLSRSRSYGLIRSSSALRCATCGSLVCTTCGSSLSRSSSRVAVMEPSYDWGTTSCYADLCRPTPYMYSDLPDRVSDLELSLERERMEKDRLKSRCAAISAKLDEHTSSSEKKMPTDLKDSECVFAL